MGILHRGALRFFTLVIRFPDAGGGGMKKVLLLALLSLNAVGLLSQQITLAVTRVEPVAVDAETAQRTEDALQAELEKLPQFKVLARVGLDQALEGRGLKLSAINDAESASLAGSAAGVQKAVFGAISRYDSAYVQFVLTVRVVDVERASIEAAETVQIRSKADIPSAASVIVGRLSGRVVPVGTITRVDGGAIYVSLGEAWGVAASDALSVMTTELTRDEAGKILLREERGLANLVVEKASPEGSLCRVLEKASDLQVGMSVRKGAADIQQETKAGIVVESVPDNAQVFWDDGLLGVTPLRSGDLQPGTHKLEIRYAAGFKPYSAQVNLKPGQTLSISRELAREPDLEELLLLGKVPRKHTDPVTALLWAIIPGAGAYYNGFPLQTAAIVQSVMLLPVLPEMNASHIEWLRQEVANGPRATDYHSLRDYYENVQSIDAETLFLAVLLAGAAMPYVGSLFDAWLDARTDFTYPAFISVSSGGSYGFIHQAQTNDSHVSDVSSAILSTAMAGFAGQSPGFFLDYAIEAVRQKISIEIEYYFGEGNYSYGSGIWMNPCFSYRLYINELFQIGLGVNSRIAVSYNGSFPSTELSAGFPLRCIFPSLGISARTGRLETDMYLSPYGLLLAAAADVTSSGSMVDNSMQVAGFWGKADFKYYFAPKIGIRLIVEAAWLLNIDTGLTSQGFSTIADYQMLQAKLGMVFRL
jgi:hypothetical protein